MTLRRTTSFLFVIMTAISVMYAIKWIGLTPVPASEVAGGHKLRQPWWWPRCRSTGSGIPSERSEHYAPTKAS